MNEKISVGFDGTDPSIEAVMWAAHEADLRQLPLRIVSCLAMPAMAGADPHGWAAGEAFVTARTCAELALQFCNTARERRLRDAEVARRSPQAAVLGYGGDVLELGQLHGWILAISNRYR